MKKHLRLLLVFSLAFIAIFALSACDKTPETPISQKTQLGKIVLSRDMTSNSLIFNWKTVDNASSYDFSFSLGEHSLHFETVEQVSEKKVYSVTVNPSCMNQVGEYYAFVTAKANPEKYLFSTSETFKISVPLGSMPEYPIEIHTVEDFEKIHKNPLFYNYTLMADLDFKGATIKPIGYNKEGVTGDQSYYFSGVFNGNNHTLKNFSLESSAMDTFATLPTIGLFKYLKGATISDLNIVNATSNSTGEATVAKENIGILAGAAQNSQITNVVITQSSIRWITPHVGYKTAMSPTIISPEISLGGLVGQVFRNNVIKGCSFSGAINLESPFNQALFDSVDDAEFVASLSNFRVGGLIGYARVDSLATKDLIIDSCFFDGRIDILGHNILVGGFIGDIEGQAGAKESKYTKITNSYAKGVLGVSAEERHDDVSYLKRVGLFIGNSNHNIIDKCYASVAVTIKQFDFDKVSGLDMSQTVDLKRTIGFIGYNRTVGVFPREITNCYVDGTLNLSNENLVSVGGFPAPIGDQYLFDTKTLLTAESCYNQSSYVGWDFENVWQAHGDKMPTLR